MKKVYVIFDGPPGHEAGRFVEVEDEHGNGLGPTDTGADWEQVVQEPSAASVAAGDQRQPVIFWQLGPFSVLVPEEVAEVNRSLDALRLEVSGEVVAHHAKIVRQALGTLEGAVDPTGTRVAQALDAFIAGLAEIDALDARSEAVMRIRDAVLARVRGERADLDHALGALGL